MDEIEEEGKELYIHHGVLMPTSSQPSNRDDSQCSSGTLSIVEYPTTGICIEWKPTTVSVVSETHDAEWAMVNTIGERPALNLSGSRGPTSMQNWLRSQIHVANLESFRTTRNGQQLSFVERGKTTNSPHVSQYFFQHGNADCFLMALRGCVKSVRSRKDKNLYHVMTDQPESQVLGKSFAELNLFPENTSETVWKFVRNLQHRPYETTLEAFSKLTDVLLYRPLEQPRAESEVAELLNQSLTIDDASGLSGDEYEVIGADLQEREPVSRGTPLTVEQWNSYFDEDGKVPDVSKIKEVIFRGGVCHELRKEVWKYLLGYLPWCLTHNERTQLRKQKVNEYYQMKLQWRTLSAEQEQRFSDFRERKSLIEKDVNRTDRTMPFYAGEENANLQHLYDILMTYVMYNFDLGYVQGMSDLLSPILYVMPQEVEAFWCFVGFMELVSSNFELAQAGMKQQLQQLHCLVSVVEPELAAYLDQHESGNMFFCFRWLLVLFKREFTYYNIMQLWEVLWTGLPCPNFHLLICVAILDAEKNTLMENQYGFTEILKHINDLSLRIDINTVISEAEGIYNQLKSVPQLPDVVRRIIGMELIGEPEPPKASTSGHHTTNKSSEEEPKSGTVILDAHLDTEVGDAAAACILAERFAGRYGDPLPEFFLGSLEDAAKESCLKPAKDGCLLAMYLHRDCSPLGEVFFAHMCSKSVLECLADYFIVWAKDLTRDSTHYRFFELETTFLGNSASNALRNIDIEKLPALILIAKMNSVIQVIQIFYSDIGPNELLTEMMDSVHLFTGQQRLEMYEESDCATWEFVSIGELDGSAQ